MIHTEELLITVIKVPSSSLLFFSLLWQTATSILANCLGQRIKYLVTYDPFFACFDDILLYH